MDIAPASPDQLDAMVAVALECQRDPHRHIAYVSSQGDAIASEIEGVARWAHHTTMARAGRRPVGWLLAETDAAMGRVWWWGPFVTQGIDWAGTADDLYRSARRRLSGFAEEEMVADARSRLIPALARAQGFRVEEGSALLSRLPSSTLVSDDRIRPMVPGEADQVRRLHDRLFPGTHTSGSRLVTLDDDRRAVLVLADGDEVVGYVATELQHDGSLSIDYLGVDPGRRGHGHGRSLVTSACVDGFRRGAGMAHLSVRESNTAARSLYRSLGFTEERVIHPYRKGFTLV